MIKRTLKQIQNMVKGSGLDNEYNDRLIEGVSIDTRTIKKNQLYIPIIGERFNGHDFIVNAIENGAIAALWDKKQPIPEVDIPLILVDDTVKAIQELSKEYRNQLNTIVIGVTGSNGKTSTKDILASILKTKYKTHKTSGNLNNHLGVPLTLLRMEEDTEMAVVEMGMEELGEIELLSNLASPDVAIITNSTDVHINTLGSVENILKAKLEIVLGLKENGLLAYLGDSPALREGVEKLNLKQKKITFGIESKNDYMVKFLYSNEDGISFQLEKPTDKTLHLSMLGRHNMYNASAAIAVARYLNVSYEEIQEGMAVIERTGMRNELIHAKGFDILNDAYKSNPISLNSALETMYLFKNYKQKILVLGDMFGTGENEVRIHEKIGEEINTEEIDYVFTIGELAENIAKKARLKYKENRVFSFTSKKELVEKLKEVIKEKAIILIKGSRVIHLEEVVEALESFEPKLK
ncbi:UDP-N-acetylmuramoyl-tripeptide--D-alanyl-D-alanine ligase [Sporosalibacterium faouarense]|uniref:UDP-N-acetylmuramoyl-tripeptide--D-alanyl-D- alanine ligase n=1 Tax=Sporosalibacterium faouarense TaxID=516123 RepID=UPI00192BA668|nr:UDP-N-acetylmuramoyl-tripeptide--D-alanyl-D-alanine ligase [Sporosalibacterium faouarense]